MGLLLGLILFLLQLGFSLNMSVCACVSWQYIYFTGGDSLWIFCFLLWMFHWIILYSPFLYISLFFRLLEHKPVLNVVPPSMIVSNDQSRIVVFASAYVWNMHDGTTCAEAGYKNITSLSQCKYAFFLVPEHPGKRSYSVSWRHCSSFVVPASIWMVVSVLFCFWCC